MKKSTRKNKKNVRLTSKKNILKVNNLFIFKACDYLRRENIGELLKLFRNQFNSINKVLQLTFISVRLCLSLGESLRKSKRFEDALLQYQNSILVDPYQSKSFFEKGIQILYYRKMFRFNFRIIDTIEQDRFKEALIELKNALLLSPNHVKTLIKIGFCLYSLNELEEAKIYYDKAQDLDEKNLQALIFRIEYLYEYGKYDEALNILEGAMLLYPNFCDLFYLKGFCLAGKEQFNEALEMHNQAIYLNPNVGPFYGGKGECLRSLHLYKQSIRCVDAQLAIGSDEAAPLVCKGIFLKYPEARCLQALQKESQALALFDQALALDPDDILTYYFKAQFLKDLKQYQQTLIVLQKALKIEPNDIDLLCTQGQCLISLNQFKKANLVFEKALLIDNQHQEALEGKKTCQKELKKKK